jgi:zinc protease
MMATQKTYALPSTENITRVELDNGIIVLVYENHSVQSVYMTGTFHAGGIYNSPEQSGLASMTASALMHGTTQRDFDALHTHLEDIGADFGFGCGVHNASFSGKALAEDLPVLVDVLADTLRNPAFPEEQFERLRGERLTALRYSQQDTHWLAGRAFRKALYPENHPYHHSVAGTMQTLPTLTASAARAFHQTHYGPKGMTITIVGAINADDAINVVRSHLGEWKNSNQPNIAELPEIAPPTETQRINIAVPGKTQANVIMGTLGPPRSADDFQAANLANSILGEFGMMGRIGNVVREQNGMAYYAGSNLAAGIGPGTWMVNAGVDPVNADRAIELSIGELRRITTEPVSEEDLTDNQSYLTGRLPLYLESNKGIAATLQHMENYNLGLDYLLNYHELIYSLTRDDLLAAAQNYLDPDALVIVVAGPNGD